MRVSKDLLVNRMRWYLAAKNKADEDRQASAEDTCRNWLKWAGWWRLSHKERHLLYLRFRQ